MLWDCIDDRGVAYSVRKAGDDPPLRRRLGAHSEARAYPNGRRTAALATQSYRTLHYLSYRPRAKSRICDGPPLNLLSKSIDTRHLGADP